MAIFVYYQWYITHAYVLGSEKVPKPAYVIYSWHPYSQYFGDPINCDFKGLDKNMANDYCWIHGSPYIPHGQYQYQRHIMKCIVEYEDLKKDKDDVPYTAYYQVMHFEF